MCATHYAPARTRQALSNVSPPVLGVLPSPGLSLERGPRERVQQAPEYTSVRPKTCRGAVSDIQREDGPKLDQGVAGRRLDFNCSELCGRPCQGEGFGAREARLVGEPLGSFGEASPQRPCRTAQMKNGEPQYTVPTRKSWTLDAEQWMDLEGHSQNRTHPVLLV